MKKRIRVKAYIVFMVIIAMLLALLVVVVEAKEPGIPGVKFGEMAQERPFDGIIGDEDGFIYVFKNGKLMTGYFKFEGNWYYGHKTNGNYPRGAVTMGQMRIRGRNNWYAYDIDGRQICNDVYIRQGKNKKVKQLQLAKDNRVLYVYDTAKANRERYSTEDRRWQMKKRNGKWHTPEQMQSIPGDWVDFQR